VLIDATFLGAKTTGMERYLWHLLPALRSYATVYVARSQSVVSFAEVADKEYVGPPNRVVAQQLWFPFLASRLRPSSVLLASVGAPVLLGTPAVMLLHDVVPWRHPEWSSRGAKFYGRFATEWLLSRSIVRQIVTVSEFSAEEIRAVLRPRCPVHVIGAGTERMDRSEVGGPPRSRPYFLTVGTVEPRKNLSTLLQAWALFRQKTGWPGDLVVVGRRGWGEQPNAPAGVVFAGYVSDQNLAAYYAHAVAVVSTSLYEGFGLPVVEAAACGALVVASALPPYIESLGSAFIRIDNPLNPADVSHALQKALSLGAEERRRMLRDAQQMVQRLSWQAAADRLWQVLQSLGIQGRGT